MPADFAKILLDPGSAYEGPEDVLRDGSITREQKTEILRRWQYNAAEEAVALEEGMPGEESDLLRRILIALGEVAGPLNVELSGPSKQHGLSRKAVGLPKTRT